MPVIFDRGNSILNDLMAEKLALDEGDHILEIGFGTGKFIGEIAKRLKGGSIEGVDFSTTMCAMAQRRNKKYIKEGKVIIRRGDFQEMDWRENGFDKICSANTIYFWKNPARYLNQIFRILKPGGNLILAFEDKAQLERRSLNTDVFKCYSLDEIKTLLSNNGFQGAIKHFARKKKAQVFHCVVATKGAR
jgi:ubiquinone/menaquinone biosynthesis C-methylase UbiE